MSEPRDELAERGVLGAILRATVVPESVSALINPTDLFEPRHVAVAEALWDMTARAHPCDPVSVRAELLRRGHRGETTDGVWLLGLVEAALPAPEYHARLIRDLSVRRQVLKAFMRGQQLAEDPGVDPYDTSASLAVTMQALAERADPLSAVQLQTLEQFLAGPETYDWAVPGLLERGDRLLLTGTEGGGKSVMLRQIALCAASGVHPFTGKRHEPLNVLLVDLENGERHLRRALRAMYEHARRVGKPERLHIESRPAGIDLMRPEDEAWLAGLCAAAQPDILIVGPLYRMHAGDMAKEEAARQLTQTLDALRARHGCAVIVETHATHAQGPGPRSLRPIGSSLFMRWPEFGYGLRPSATEGVVDVVSWRGARDEREWPKQLMRGGAGAWPWVEFNEHAQNVRRYWSEVEPA